MMEPRLDIVGAALADPSRLRILCELMDGRAFTNKELACAAGVRPQTASAHLKQLEATGLTVSLRSGRHVYHRISGQPVAETLEKLAGLSPRDHLSRFRSKRTKTPDAFRARSCYDHIAGRLGVLVTQRLATTGVLRIEGDSVSPGARFCMFADELGIEVPCRADGRPVKLCLDWTERRHHISGPLATALLRRSLASGWLKRCTGSRALAITDTGYETFGRWFALDRKLIDAHS